MRRPCEKAGRKCAGATHAQTLVIARIMTEVRRQAGIKFPFEK